MNAPKRAESKYLFWMLDIVVVQSALWILLAVNAHFLIAGPLIGLTLIMGCVLLIACATSCWRSRLDGMWRTFLTVLSIPVILVVLPGLLYLELRGVDLYYHAYPPPRPLFHNDLGMFNPRWRAYMGYMGESHRWLGDHEHNILVIIMYHDFQSYHLPNTRAGLNSATIHLGEGEQVTIDATPNMLHVMKVGQGSHSFRLQPGMAQQFEHWLIDRPLADVRELLAPGQEAEFDTWVKKATAKNGKDGQ